MSNIYNLEPSAQGHIIFKTTFGNLELELFTKQCPKNCKNFVQNCLDGYYKGTIFDRVEKDFIAIGGKQQAGCNKQFGAVVPDEFHPRLKFSRRGLLATANTEKNSNGSEFFFTLGPAPELQNKHSIFGRLKGNSIYCLVDLNDCPVDDELCPLGVKEIIEVVVEENPFPELEIRQSKVVTSCQSQEEGTNSDDGYLQPRFDTKHSKKLSFYQQSDDEEDEVEKDDNEEKKDESAGDMNASEFKGPLSEESHDESQVHSSGTNEDYPSNMDASTSEEIRAKKLREIRDEIRKLKEKLENESSTKIRTLTERRQRASQESLNSPLNVTVESRASSSRHSSIKDLDLVMQSQELRLATKKGRQRERETIGLMERFKKKLRDESSASASKLLSATNDNVKNPPVKTNTDDEYAGDSYNDILEDALDMVDGDDWLRHKFEAHCDPGDTTVKDANIKGDDWYSIDDPRNALVNRVESKRARDYKSATMKRSSHREDDTRHRNEHKHSNRSRQK